MYYHLHFMERYRYLEQGQDSGISLNNAVSLSFSLQYVFPWTCHTGYKSSVLHGRTGTLQVVSAPTHQAGHTQYWIFAAGISVYLDTTEAVPWSGHFVLTKHSTPSLFRQWTYLCWHAETDGANWFPSSSVGSQSLWWFASWVGRKVEFPSLWCHRCNCNPTPFSPRCQTSFLVYLHAAKDEMGAN